MTCRTTFERNDESAWKLIIGAIFAFVLFEAGWMYLHRQPHHLPVAAGHGESKLGEYSKQDELQLYVTPRNSAASLLPTTDEVFGQVSVASADGDFVGDSSFSDDQLAEEFTGIPAALYRTDRFSSAPTSAPAEPEEDLPIIRVPGRFRVKMPAGPVATTVVETNSFPNSTFETPTDLPTDSPSESPAESGFAFQLAEESPAEPSEPADNSLPWGEELVPPTSATDIDSSIEEGIVNDGRALGIENVPLTEAGETRWDEYPSTSYEAMLPKYETDTEPVLSPAAAANRMLNLTKPQESIVEAPKRELEQSPPASVPTILNSGVRVSHKIARSLPGSDVLPIVNQETAAAHGMIQNPFVR
jgi:hypothetical protein